MKRDARHSFSGSPIHTRKAIKLRADGLARLIAKEEAERQVKNETKQE